MSFRKKYIKSKFRKIKPKKSIFKNLWFWIAFLFVIIIASLCYFVLFYPGTQIKDIIILGNQKVAREDIEDLVLRNIDNKILSIGGWGVHSKSIFMADSNKLKNEILNKFPAIKSVEIDKKFMQTLIFNLTEKVSAATFCSSQECYFMDDEGMIFELLHAVPENMLIVRQAVNNEEIFIGERVVQQDIIDLISKVEKNLKDNFQINLKEATIKSLSRLDITTSEGWGVYFDISQKPDMDLQLAKLGLLLSGNISAGQGGYSRKNLRYIDLRPKDRAIVCDNKTCGG